MSWLHVSDCYMSRPRYMSCAVRVPWCPGAPGCDGCDTPRKGVSRETALSQACEDRMAENRERDAEFSHRACPCLMRHPAMRHVRHAALRQVATRHHPVPILTHSNGLSGLSIVRTRYTGPEILPEKATAPSIASAESFGNIQTCYERLWQSPSSNAKQDQRNNQNGVDDRKFKQLFFRV